MPWRLWKGWAWLWGVVKEIGFNGECFKIPKPRRSIGLMLSDNMPDVHAVVSIKSGVEEVEVEEQANLF